MASFLFFVSCSPSSNDNNGMLRNFFLKDFLNFEKILFLRLIHSFVLSFVRRTVRLRIKCDSKIVDTRNGNNTTLSILIPIPPVKRAMIAVNFTDVVGLRNFEKNAQQKMDAEFTHITHQSIHHLLQNTPFPLFSSDSITPIIIVVNPFLFLD